MSAVKIVCSKCRSSKQSTKFRRNKSNKKTGRDSVCKDCRKLYAKENRIKENARKERYRKHSSHKDKARKEAAKVFGGRRWFCSVLNCNEAGNELHHIDYNKPLEVIPLCKKHHHIVHIGVCNES